MPRQVFQFAAAVVLLFATLTPLANCFDTWDKNPAPANDTELHVAAWFVGAGIVLVIAKTVRAMPVPARGARPMRMLLVASQTDGGTHDISPAATASPPLIPLRI